MLVRSVCGAACGEAVEVRAVSTHPLRAHRRRVLAEGEGELRSLRGHTVRVWLGPIVLSVHGMAPRAQLGPERAAHSVHDLRTLTTDRTEGRQRGVLVERPPRLAIVADRESVLLLLQTRTEPCRERNDNLQLLRLHAELFTLEFVE